MPCTERLACSSWKPGNLSDLGIINDVGCFNDGSTCWNCGIDLKSERSWKTLSVALGWVGPRCGSADKEFTRTWSLPFYGGGGGSLVAWVITVGPCYAAKWLDLDLVIVGGFGEDLRIYIYLRSMRIDNRDSWFKFIKFEFLVWGILWFSESRDECYNMENARIKCRF